MRKNNGFLGLKAVRVFLVPFRFVMECREKAVFGIYALVYSKLFSENNRTFVWNVFAMIVFAVTPIWFPPMEEETKANNAEESFKEGLTKT